MQTAQNEVQRLYDEFKNEAEAKSGTMKYGYGPVAKQKEQRYLEFNKQGEAFDKRALKEMSKIDARQEALDQTKNTQLKSMDEKQALATGFLARAAGLHRLMKERPVIAWIKWGITLILLLLECIPIFAKLFSI